MKHFAALLRRLETVATSQARRDAVVGYLHEAAGDAAACGLQLLRGRGPRGLLNARSLREALNRDAGLAPWLIEHCLQTSGDLLETAALLLPPAAQCESPTLDVALARMRAMGDLARLRAIGDCARLHAPAEAARTPMSADNGSNPIHGAYTDSIVQTCAAFDSAVRELWLRLALGRWHRRLDDALLQHALALWAGIDLRCVRLRWAALTDRRAAFDGRALAALVAPISDSHDASAMPMPFAAIETAETAGATADADADADASAIASANAAVAVTAMPAHDDGGVVHRWLGMRRVQLIRRAAGCWLWTEDGELLNDSCAHLLSAAAQLPVDTVLEGELLCGEPGRWVDRAALERWLAAGAKRERANAPHLVLLDALQWAGQGLQQVPYRQRRGLLTQAVSNDGLWCLLESQVPKHNADADLRALRRAGFEGLLHLCGDAWPGATNARVLHRAPRHALRAVVQTVQWGQSPQGCAGVELGVALWRSRAAGPSALLRLAAAPQADAVTQPFAPLAKLWLDADAAAMAGLSTGRINELTVQRFGPLRLLRPEWVCDLVFDAVLPNPRRRSGAVLAGAEFAGWCEDPALATVNELADLQALLPAADPEQSHRHNESKP